MPETVKIDLDQLLAWVKRGIENKNYYAAAKLLDEYLEKARAADGHPGPEHINWDAWQDIVGRQSPGATDLEADHMSWLNESELVELLETGSVTIVIGNEPYVIALNITKETV